MYGINTTGNEYSHLAEMAVRAFSEIHVPGGFWVESLPALRHIPGWLPGVRFKKYAEFYRPYVEKMVSQPFDLVKASLVSYYLYFIVTELNNHRQTETRVLR